MIEIAAQALPLRWRLQRRADYSRFRGHIFRSAAVLLALFLAAAAFAASGRSPLDLARQVVSTTLGSTYGRQELLLLATPIILNGAAFSLGMHMRLFNLGLEGQLYMGAFFGAAVGLHLHGPSWLMLPLIFLAGILGGALYALVPALMRIELGVSEILTTLLMNPLAIQWATYVGMVAWRDTSMLGVSSNATARLPLELPILPGGTPVGILLAVLVVVGMWLALTRTTWGYEVISIGANRGAAQFAGMPVARNMLVVMLLSGAIAGLSGVHELTAVDHQFSGRISPGYGWFGIDAAILAGDAPLALLPWGLFLALVLYAGIVLKAQGLSIGLVLALTGLILLFASIGEVAANYRLVRAGRPEQETGLERAGREGGGPSSPERACPEPDVGPDRAS
jgi:ABC-type uncharacterized transport system permease subunit